MMRSSVFFNPTATTHIYPLSLHDALPISWSRLDHNRPFVPGVPAEKPPQAGFYPDDIRDRKSTRLNSSHPSISYAVFCLKKKRRVLTVRSRLRFAPGAYLAGFRAFVAR